MFERKHRKLKRKFHCIDLIVSYMEFSKAENFKLYFIAKKTFSSLQNAIRFNLANSSTRHLKYHCWIFLQKWMKEFEN